MAYDKEQYSIIDRLKYKIDSDGEIRKIMFNPRFSEQILL